MRRYRRNSDEGLRELERRFHATGGAGEEATYLTALARKGSLEPWVDARRRQLVGEPLQPWELYPASYVFRRACESWLWAGTRPGASDPARVEGVRLAFSGKGVKLSDGNRQTRPIDLSTLAVGVIQDENLPRWTGTRWEPAFGHVPPRALNDLILNEPLEIDGVPFAPNYSLWRTGLQALFASPAQEVTSQMTLGHNSLAPTERFYVVPSSYPMYRGWHDANILMDETYPFDAAVAELGVEWDGSAVARERLEQAIHLAAVRYYVSRGAIPYSLQDTPNTLSREGRSRSSGFVNYASWWEIYRQRVLVCVENRVSAASFSGGWMSDRILGRRTGEPPVADHNAKVLIPEFWEKARLMNRVRGRWKNNPDEDLRRLERAAAQGDPEARASLEAARRRVEPTREMRRMDEILTLLAGAPLDWEGPLEELVDLAVEHYGARPDALAGYLLRPGTPGLDWIYTRKISPWGLDNLYWPVIQRALGEVGVDLDRVSGANFAVRPRGAGFTIYMDVYFTSHEDYTADEALTAIDSALSEADEELAEEHAPGLGPEPWDVEVGGNEFEDGEWEAQVVMECPFTLYHLFGFTGISVSFKPKVEKSRHKVRRKRRRR